MFCKNCGTKINDDEKFCEKCKKEISEVREKKDIENDFERECTSEDLEREKDIEENRKYERFSNASKGLTPNFSNRVKFRIRSDFIGITLLPILLPIYLLMKLLLHMGNKIPEVAKCLKTVDTSFIILMVIVVIINSIKKLKIVNTMQERNDERHKIKFTKSKEKRNICNQESVPSQRSGKEDEILLEINSNFKFFKNRLKYKYAFKPEKEINYDDILFINSERDYYKNKTEDSGRIILGTKVDKKILREYKKNTLFSIIAPIIIFFICVMRDDSGFLFMLIGLPTIVVLQIISGLERRKNSRRRTPTKINIDNVENVEETCKKIKAIVEGRTEDIQ